MGKEAPRSPRQLANQVAILEEEEEEEEEGDDGSRKSELFNQEVETKKLDGNITEYTEVKAFRLSSSSGSSVGAKPVARSQSERARGALAPSASSTLQRKSRSQSEHAQKGPDDSHGSNESYDTVDFNLVSFSGNEQDYSSSEAGDLTSQERQKNIVSEKRKKKRKLTPLIKVGERLRGKNNLDF